MRRVASLQYPSLRSPSEHALDALLSYEWLPVEGKDFRVEFKDDTVNGVTMRSESFFPM